MESLKNNDYLQFLIICGLLLAVIVVFIIAIASVSMADFTCADNPIKFAEQTANLSCSCFELNGV